MEQDEISLEEGEISEDPADYSPLERPSNYSLTQPNPRLPQLIPHSESEEEIQSTDTDSDSDSNIQTKKIKKPRIKLKSSQQLLIPKRKKYDIWSNRAQEEALAETLNSCDVTSKDRSRSVETYDYSLGYKYYNEESNVHKPFSDRGDKHGYKRTRDDRKNVNYKRRRRSPTPENVRGSQRILPDLTVDVDSKEEDIAKDIGNKLCEEREDLILKVVRTMGRERSIEIFNDTKEIEAEGGMLVMNQTRRRTPGGVFLYLVRHDYHITPDQKQEIFGEDRQKSRLECKAKQKEKSAQMKKAIAAERAKMLPDLLSRSEVYINENTDRNIKDPDEPDISNPPPTPEADVHENSNDGMESGHPPVINGSTATLENARDKLCAYDEDFLDIGSSADMDLF